MAGQTSGLHKASMQADVLVVGGGLAGLRAAYEARRAGAEVILAVKGKAGRSGSSAMTSAGYSSAIKAGDTPELHLRDTIVGGREINDPQLAAIFTEEAPARLRELISLGAPMQHDELGEIAVHPSGDHSVPRTAVAANHIGLDFTLPLARAAADVGVRVMESTAVLDVRVNDGEVLGALALDYASGESIQMDCPSVILAAGGAGRLFSVTSNPNDATGDGYAIALRAGAELRDMEFVQFYPWRCIIPFDRNRMPIQPSTFVFGGILKNQKGERFMLRYDPDRGEATTRDVAARAIYEQIQAGVGISGGVELDLSSVSDEAWASSNPRVAKYFTEHQINFRDVHMVLSPEAHFFMGGVVVDENAESRIRGLYAVGETAGGVHGANRLDSNAIPEGQVFGARAGVAAAARARKRQWPRPDWAPSSAAVSASLSKGDEIAMLRAQLQNSMWNGFGIVRHGSTLTAALRAIRELVQETQAVGAGTPRERVHRWELENSLVVAEACLTAGIARTESRGAHYRSDFPVRDDRRWRESVRIELPSDGSLRLQLPQEVAA